MSCEAMTPSDWINVAGTLAATFVGAWLGYLLAGKQERTRDEKLHRSLRSSLLAEVERCAEQANTYLQQNILAPAYRFPSSVYEAAFPQLISSGTLASEGVTALLDFYSQVRQVNWCLDEIHQYRDNDRQRAQDEARRLKAKLLEMNSPQSRFYSPAVNALKS